MFRGSKLLSLILIMFLLVIVIVKAAIIGYTGGRNTASSIADNFCIYGGVRDGIAGTMVSPETDITITSITAQIEKEDCGGSDYTFDLSVSIYKVNASGANNHSLIQIDEFNNIDVSGGNAWHNFDITDIQINSTDDYIFALSGDGSTFNSGEGASIGANSTAPTFYFSDAAITYPGTDPWEKVGGVGQYQIYGNYTSEPEDTCTPPASGDYAVTASDACQWTENDEIPGNITITGPGTVDLLANWTFTGSNQYVFIHNGSQFNIHSGGGFNSGT